MAADATGARPPGYRERFFREPVAADLKAVMETERARPLHAEYHRFDKAHVVMLLERGLIPVGPGVAILRALRELEDGPVADRRTEAGGGAHAGEQIVASLAGEEVAGHIHLGRSTGDLTATAVRLLLRRRLVALLGALAATCAALLDKAADHLDTVLAGYTHGQQTQPVTFGHMLVAYGEALARDGERARQAFERTDRSPAGGVIMAGTSVPIDRERVAELLGFGRVDTNTYDAVLAQDVLIEAMWVVAIVSADVARIAEDLMFLSATEISVVAVPDRYSGTSSIAVHKRNPYAPQVMKGAGAAALGALVTAFAVEKGPSGMAMQDRGYTLRALWSGLDDLERDLRWTADIVSDLQVDPSRALALAGEHWATSTDVGALLVEKHGLSWRTAHQVVGIFVRDLQSRGVRPAEATPDQLATAAAEVTGERLVVEVEDLRDALDARAFVERRDHVGAPAPREVRRQLAAARKAVERDAREAGELEERFRRADEALDAAVDRCLAMAAEV